MYPGFRNSEGARAPFYARRLAAARSEAGSLSVRIRMTFSLPGAWVRALSGTFHPYGDKDYFPFRRHPVQRRGISEPNRRGIPRPILSWHSHPTLVMESPMSPVSPEESPSERSPSPALSLEESPDDRSPSPPLSLMRPPEEGSSSSAESADRWRIGLNFAEGFYYTDDDKAGPENPVGADTRGINERYDIVYMIGRGYERKYIVWLAWDRE